MSDSLTSHLAQLEQQRVEALLTVDADRFDALHDPAYQLCNPTGTVWGKAEYLQLLTTGRLAYSRLDLTSEIDVMASETLAVLRYRCLIALRVDSTDIPTHECHHIDVYVRGDDGQWRCRCSQAPGSWTPPSPRQARRRTGSRRTDRGPSWVTGRHDRRSRRRILDGDAAVCAVSPTRTCRAARRRDSPRR